MQTIAPPDNRPLEVIQITDCHLGAQPGERLLGLDADESLLDVLQKVQQGFTPDLILATGDISCHGDVSSYQRFASYIKRHLDYPLAWLPGNHDLASVMQEMERDFPFLQSGLVDLGCWQIVLLDSSVLGCDWGNLDGQQLNHLECCLAGTDKHTLVFVHHQPVPVGSEWMDQYIIRNADTLLGVLAQHTHVKGLIWGHVHQEFESQHQGLPLLATPSTCVQFKPNSDDFAVDNAMPGYRWFHLYPDGRFESGVERVDHKDYGIDFSSGGY